MLTHRFVKEKLLDDTFSHRPKIPATFIGQRTSLKFLATLDLQRRKIKLSRVQKKVW